VQERQVQSRERLGLEIAARSKIERKGSVWLVPSQSGHKRYTVCPDPTEPHCSCPDHAETGQLCKHLFAVRFVMSREEKADASGTVTEAVIVSKTTTIKPTYRQNCPAYNRAQANEKHKFMQIAHDLCQNLPPVQRGRGRPPLPLSDSVFAVLLKVYCGHSARRTQCDLHEAYQRGYLTRVPHYNAIPNLLASPGVTPILHDLVTKTSLPLKDIGEVDFAVDSSGFTGKNYTPWFDKLYRGKKEHKWQTVHLICGVETNIVTAVIIKGPTDGDAPQLPALVNRTARNFKISEVSADGAYTTVAVHEAIVAVGATGYTKFSDKKHTGASGGIFKKMFHFYKLHEEEYLKHYHKRSNIETTFWMIKSKFGTHIRSKTETAMVNEVLCKVVDHNICVLIQSMYELGIVTEFFPTEVPAAAD
jgi:transposase